MEGGREFAGTHPVAKLMRRQWVDRSPHVVVRREWSPAVAYVVEREAAVTPGLEQSLGLDPGFFGVVPFGV